MSISFAGLSIVSLRNPITELIDLFVSKSDIRTILCLLVFSIVLLVLAYLTNPSESTFRTYLTELSFRQHLSRLDEHSDDVAAKLRQGASGTAASKGLNFVSSYILPLDESSLFHFANCTSVSLRTPKHVFHSFGIFTIAAMIPLPKPLTRNDRNALMISDSWYIGAFGKWWRGGVLETWYQDVISRSKDEESWSSGILSMKTLDMLQDLADPVTKFDLPRGFFNGSSPKLRNRERMTCRNSSLTPRSSTPPPLPKSASLPLHTTRSLPSTSERSLTVVPHQPQPQRPSSAVDAKVGASIPPRSSSTLFDQSPHITQLLEQISTSKSSLADLHTQLLDCQSSASQSHALLQEELSSHRERKRIEDSSKLETKARMKTLEDSKRSAESVKRDVDKRLKSAQSAHDQTTRRIQSLSDETTALRDQTAVDEEKLQTGVNEIFSTERELTDEIEFKKQEIREAENIVAALNRRAKELEDLLDEEREKIKKKKGLFENRKAERLHMQARCSSWSPPHKGFMGPNNHSLEANGQSDYIPYQHPMRNKLPVFTSNNSVRQQPPYVASVGHGPDEYADEVPRLSITLPVDQSLIPSGLITSLNGTESIWTNPYLEEFPNKQGHEDMKMRETCDPSSKRSSLDGHNYASVYDSTGSTEDMEFGRRVPWSTASHGDVSWRSHLGRKLFEENDSAQHTRRLFPTLSMDKSRKGLNPDAREFNMTLPSKGPSHQSRPSFDNLNPTGLGPSMMSSSASTSDSLFLRAFAPSPAEREALQRALGGTNTSFERLPSLSDVESIPSSPSHINALPHHAPNSHVNKLQLPGWLFTFPRGRKTQFSPWGDEEPPSKP